MGRNNIPLYLNGRMWLASKVIVLIVFIIITAISCECEAGSKYKIVILPFKDHSRMDLSEMVSDVLRSQVTQTGYFEAVDRDKIYETVITVIPSDLIKIDNTARVGRRFTSNQIDLIAQLDIKRVQRFSRKLRADYAVKGSVSQLRGVVRIDAEIVDVEAKEMLGFVTVEGDPDELLSKHIEELANKITLFCRNINAYNDALAIMGKYNQGQYTYDVSEKKLKELLPITNDTLGIHAVLMVLYIFKADPDEDALLEDKVIEEGNKILHLLNHDFDEKYLEVFLTSGFDPFDEMAKIYTKRHNNKMAIETYQKAISVYPINIAGHYKEMGMLYLQEGAEEKAIKAFEKSLGVNQGDYESHFALAAIFEERGFMDKAIEHLSECLTYARNAADMEAANERIQSISGGLLKPQ